MLSEILRPSSASERFIIGDSFPEPLLIPSPLLPERLMEIGLLRYESWIAEGVSPDQFRYPYWIDKSEHEGLANYYHFTVRGEDGRLEAAARLSIHESIEEVPGYKDLIKVIQQSGKEIALDPPFGAYNRLVVRPDLWNQGLGSQMLEPVLHLGIQLGCNTFITGITTRLLERTLKRGFEYIGEEESFRNIPTHNCCATRESVLINKS